MNSGRVWEILMEMFEQFHTGTLEPKRVKQMQELLKAFQQAAQVEQTMSTVRLQDANAIKAMGQSKMLSGGGMGMLPADIDAEYSVDVS